MGIYQIYDLREDELREAWHSLGHLQELEKEKWPQDPPIHVRYLAELLEVMFDVVRTVQVRNAFGAASPAEERILERFEEFVKDENV